MKIKSIVILAFFAITIFCFAGFANAQASQTQDQVTQQLIQLLIKMITQIQEEIQQILSLQKDQTQSAPTPTSCTPNWQCQWGSCVNGYQSQTAVDLNNCGVVTGNNFACPALAQACSTAITQCGKLIYFCSDNSPFCKQPFSLSIDQYAQNSGCVEVVKHIIPDFMQLSSDPLAIQYGNIAGVPTYLFINKDGCFSDIGKGGSTTVNDIINGINNFSCELTPAQHAPCGDILSTVWYNGSTEIRRDPYYYSTDQCSGYRCLTKNAVSPSCYSESECKASCSGQCINILVAKQYCNLAPTPRPVPTPTPTQSSITITSPNSGDIFTQGSIKNISWSSAGLLPTDRIDIYLYHYGADGTKDGQSMITSTSGVAMFYPWIVSGITGLSNSNYKILIQVYRDTIHNIVLVNGMSNDFFSITTPMPSQPAN